MIEPVEDVDFFVIKRVRYELHVDGTYFITADEECDDFEIEAHRIDLSEPMVVGQTVMGNVERRIDDPTKPFDRVAWVVAHNPEMHSGDLERPKSETKLNQFDRRNI